MNSLEPQECTRTNETHPFFVYTHRRNDTGEIFYVGIGKKYKKRFGTKYEFQRAYEKSGRNPHWKAIVAKHGYTISIHSNYLSQQEAFAKEIQLIAFYGRKSDGGILANWGLGGEHNEGRKCTPEQIEKQRQRAFTLEQIVDKNIMFEPMTGCWVWIGKRSSADPRPRMCYKKRSISAVRFFYKLHRDPNIKFTDFLQSTCGDPECINPFHQEIETIQENRKKVAEQGRMNRGENRYNAKLTEPLVREMRSLYDGGMSIADISRKLNISDGNIGLVVRRKSWKHVQ